MARGDFAFVYNPQTADWDLAELAFGDLSRGNDLWNAIAFSIFCHRRAADEDVVFGEDRRGWIGSQFLGAELGSRLWILRQRGKLVPEIIPEATDMVNECLQWLIDDGAVLEFTVVVEILRQDQFEGRGLAIDVTAQEPDLSDPVTKKFAWIWEDLKNAA